VTEVQEDTRFRSIRRVLVVNIALTTLIGAAKIAGGLWFGLLSMTADGVNSSLDAASTVLGLFAVASARRPPDEDHPYGHRKFETFAALFLAASLGITGFELVRAAVGRVRAGAQPETGPAAFAVILVSMIVSASIALFERRKGRALGSEFLLADAQQHAGDVLVSLAVLAAMIGVWLDVAVLDLVCALGIAVFIGVMAVRLTLRSLGVLADHVAVDKAAIERVVREVEGVRSCHKVRTRGPAGHVFADLHVQVDPTVSVREGHAVAHEVVAAIRRAFPEIRDVVTHIEPYEGDGAK
jgi:cation diffusion facilitator family transporter